jgi:hypothetical protein
VGEKVSDVVSKKARVSRALLMGQLIAVLVAGTGVGSQYLAQHDVSDARVVRCRVVRGGVPRRAFKCCDRVLQVNIPTSQSTLNYFLLSLLLVYKRVREGPFRPKVRVCVRRQFARHPLTQLRPRVQIAVWRYAALAFADVEANFLVVKAYKYTTITSVMLLDCFTIPCVMLLSSVFLRARVRVVARRCVCMSHPCCHAAWSPSCVCVSVCAVPTVPSVAPRRCGCVPARARPACTVRRHLAIVIIVINFFFILGFVATVTVVLVVQCHLGWQGQ